MADNFVNNNGKILSTTEYTIETGNRGYLYGDGVFETIRVYKGVIINLENHIKRLVEGANALKMRVPVFYTTEFFNKKISELLQMNGINAGGKVRISVDRISGGNYIPEQNEAIFFIEAQAISVADFELNSKGLEIDVYQGMKKYRSKLSNFKTKNGLIYVMAGIEARERSIDEMLVMNDLNGIIESSNSNLFVVSNGVLYTPGLEEGCIAGTMRMQIINLALKFNFKVYECTIVPQNLLAADEVFFTNAIKGITWIVGYRTKRYFNNTSRKLLALLNDYWEDQIKGDQEIDASNEE